VKNVSAWLSIVLAVLLVACTNPIHADESTSPAYFTYGPLSLVIPFKTASVTYLYDFHVHQNLVGGETPFVTIWNRVEGDFGAITSLQGAGTPFIGGNLILGNLLDKFVTLPADLKVGGFGGWDFNAKNAIYGLKASYKLW